MRVRAGVGGDVVLLLQYLFGERIKRGAPRRNGLGSRIGQGKNKEMGSGDRGEARIRGRGSGGFALPTLASATWLA
jgi:hypothetical protein